MCHRRLFSKNFLAAGAAAVAVEAAGLPIAGEVEAGVTFPAEAVVQL